jgi:hypothetical protein
MAASTHKIMTAAQFKLLNEEKQKELVAQFGVMVALLEWEGYRIFLFQVDGFYVEYFFSAKTNELAWTTVFEDTSLLSKYLENIDITSVMR